MDAEPIAPAALDALTDSYGAAITDVHRRLPALSHFEVLSGLALRHFADQKVLTGTQFVLDIIVRPSWTWPPISSTRDSRNDS